MLLYNDFLSLNKTAQALANIICHAIMYVHITYDIA